MYYPMMNPMNPMNAMNPMNPMMTGYPPQMPPPVVQAPAPVQQLSVGLLKKNQKNDIETYAKMSRILPSSNEGMIANDLCNYFKGKFQENPQEFFNFGFNYNDFKQFLLKLLFMRAERRFFEKSFLQQERTTEARYLHHRAETEDK